jgi:hypothetical protein
LESSTDFATNDVISGASLDEETILSFLSFLGLPGQFLIFVLGFFETNSFFGLPGHFFTFVLGLFETNSFFGLPTVFFCFTM